MLVFTCCLWPLAESSVQANESQEVSPLAPSVPTGDRKLTTDEVHEFRATLDAGAWRLVLKQNGVDTVTHLKLPDGSASGPFNSPTARRGTETVSFELERRGTVHLSIRGFRGNDGRYSALLERLAAAKPRDRTAAEHARVQAEALVTEASRLFVDGSKEGARERYGAALARWPAVDPAGRARVLVALGLLSRSLEAPETAAMHYREAIAIWRSLGHREDEATTLNRLGLVLQDLGRIGDAGRHFEQALERWLELGDTASAVPSRLNLCLVLQRNGDFADARDCYEVVLDLTRSLEQRGREAIVLLNLAGVYWKLGDVDRALELFDESIRRSQSEALRGRGLANRAMVYVDLGEAEQALLDFGEALEVFRQLKSKRSEGRVLTHLGTTYRDLGELERARIYLQQALPLRREVKDQRGVAEALRGLGQTHVRQGHFSEAYEAFGEALELSRSLGDPRGEATVLLFLGRAHAEEGALLRAVPELAKAAELNRGIGDRRREAQALLELAKAHLRENDLAPAKELLDQARGMFQELRDLPGKARTLEAMALLKARRGAIPDALVATTHALDLLEDLRTRTGGLRQRAAFLATRRGVYELHIDLLMQRHRLEPKAGFDRRAFSASERARSRALLDSIRDSASLDGASRRKLEAATRRLAAQNARQMAVVDRRGNPEELAEADRGVVAALTHLEAVHASARREVATAFRGRAQGSQILGQSTESHPGTEGLVTAAEVASLLEPGTLLLHYLLAEPRSYVWVIDRRSLASYELPGRGKIEAVARRAHEDLSTLDLRTGRTPRQALEALSALVLEPVAGHLEGDPSPPRRLVVVPDGALHFLPFAALPEPRRGVPLIESFEVTHLPSGSALARQRRRVAGPAPTKTLAVLADPVFETRDPRLSSRPASRSASETPDPLLARVRGGLGALARLPATGREATSIAGLVKDPEQLLVATGFEAHRNRVLGGELASYQYLHFATHGVINSRHPDLSGLVLALLDEHGRQRNGFLSLDDVRSLALNAEMVVLSGCQTALGREMRGEGLLGLTHGFMAAGVPRIVASLWPVQDEATAELMTVFYREILERGASPAAALATAQRATRARLAWSDPYFWSAFVLVGDWR